MNEQTTLPVDQPDSPQGKLAEPNPRLRFEFSPQGIGKLIGALAKARKVFKPVMKSSKNPFFKSNYADLAEVVDATKDGLSDNELAIVQPPAFSKADGVVEVVTLLAHSSGEWIKSLLEMPVVKQDPQGVGSAITYGRRYAYSGMVSVASEADDDGNAATGNKVRTEEDEKRFEKDFDQRTANQTGENVAFGEKEQYLAPFQQKAILDAMVASGKSQDDLKTYLELAKVQDLAHVKKGEDFQALLKWANAKGKAISHPKKDGFNWPSLFASAKAKGYSEQDVKDFYCSEYGVESGTQLTAVQFAKVVEAVAKWKATTEQ